MLRPNTAAVVHAADRVQRDIGLYLSQRDRSTSRDPVTLSNAG
jgi:hypothetical protein